MLCCCVGKGRAGDRLLLQENIARPWDWAVERDKSVKAVSGFSVTITDRLRI